jgi:hypothetical protein
MSPECSQWAYERLNRAGIERRLRPIWKEIRDTLLYRNIWQGEVGNLVSHVGNMKDGKETPRFSEEFYQDVQGLERGLEDDDLALRLETENLPRHPFLLGGFVFGENLSRFGEFGFDSERQFAEAVVAYCIGERNRLSNRHETHTWRNGMRKNKISLMDHGDTSVSQSDLSGEEPLLKEYPSAGFGMNQDMSPFLAIALQYVDFLGMRDIDEIKNWEELVQEADCHTPWGYGYQRWIESGRDISFDAINFFDMCDLAGTGKKDNLPSRIERQESAVWPIVSGRNLEMYVESSEGVETFSPMVQKKGDLMGEK